MNYSLFWKPRKLLAAIRVRLDRHAAFRQAIKLSYQRFKSDPNYHPERIQDCFMPRLGVLEDDSILLRRIVAAYQKAKRDQHLAAEAFNVSNEWLPIYKHNLGAVMDALHAGDIPTLQSMYQNLFRDPCSTGLVGLPIDMPKAFFGGTIKEKHRKYVLADVLHRFHLWKQRTEGAYPVEALASPPVGNPYGYTMDGVFIRAGGDYQHYYAHAIRQLLTTGSDRIVSELGGGFGGMAFFLLRDNPEVTYVDFDLPEAIALASYFLMKSLPDREFTLYGETDFPDAVSSRPGIFLMPSFEIVRMPAKSIAVSFNSYSLAEMSPSTIRTYIREIARTTKGRFLHVNHNRNAVLSADNFGVEDYGFTLVSRDLAGWTLGINPASDEFEYLYQA